MSEHPVHRIETSLILTIAIVAVFFLLAIVAILIAPRFVDSSWLSPSSRYQVLMYEVIDPSIYISNGTVGDYNLQHVQHVKDGESLFGYIESDRVRLIAEDDLADYITKLGDEKIKLTNKLLFLRTPENLDLYKKKQSVIAKGDKKSTFDIFELYDPQLEQAFVYGADGSIENWIKSDYTLLSTPTADWHEGEGVIYIKNPKEYRVKEINTPLGKGFNYDPKGKPIKDIEELTGPFYGFRSRKNLIQEGERIFAIEGCWYCHTDQTRTLVQDVVLNGSDSYPAPPSSANEYIYQDITFAGTRRIGPDISRTGVKRPSRDWHKSHFWAPKTISAGSIMPSFHHFFDNDPRGTSPTAMGVPNRQFEAIYQYLMTKGTRITSPDEAWWLGKDPVRTKELIEGKETH